MALLSHKSQALFFTKFSVREFSLRKISPPHAYNSYLAHSIPSILKYEQFLSYLLLCYKLFCMWQLKMTNILSHTVSEGQEFRYGLSGSSGSGSLVRPQSRFWLGLQLSEGLMQTERSTLKLASVAVTRMPQFLATQTSPRVIVVSFLQKEYCKRKGETEQ